MSRKKKRTIQKHFTRIGFTNRLAIYILIFLAAGMIGGFYLAYKSIMFGYLGVLGCWTVVFTPLSTAISIALSKIVDKSKAENTVGGIKYITAEHQLTTTQAECQEETI